MGAVTRDTPLQALGDTLARRLGPGIGVGVQALEGQPEDLFPAEAAAVANAIPRRQLEFASGRTAVRQAMRQIGWPVQPVPSGPDRAPVWPTGLVGSISHCRTGCVALVAPQATAAALGVDMEDAKPLAPDLWPMLFTARELAGLQALAAPARGLQATRLFAAKEAFYKWQYPATTKVLEFQDAEVSWVAGNDRFTVTCSRLKHTPLGCTAGEWLSDARWLLAWVVSAGKAPAESPTRRPSDHGG